MNDNEVHFNEERFKRIEKTLEKLSISMNSLEKGVNQDIKTLKENFDEDVDNLVKEINELKTDYLITKQKVFDSITDLKEMPKAITSLEKVILELNCHIKENDEKNNGFSDRMEKIETKLFNVDEKGKFDFIEFIKSVIPSLLTGGVIWALMTFIK